MVLQKRLDYGFNGYQVPVIPRASRSTRGRGSLKRKVDDNQMGAFELLATVAGTLLQERETSPGSSSVSAIRIQPNSINEKVKKEQENEGKPAKAFPCDQGNVLDAEESASKSRNEFTNITSKVEGGFLCYSKCKGKVEDGIEGQVEHEPLKFDVQINRTVPDTCSSDNPLELDGKPPALVSADSSVEVPLCKVNTSSDPFPRFQDDVKLGSRNDDENSSGCTRCSTIPLKTYRPKSHIGDRRIRKLLVSKYWEVAPKLEGGHSISDGDRKPVFRNKRACYTRQRSQRNFFKRRKLSEKTSVSTSDGGVSSEGISSSPKKGMGGSLTGSGSTVHGASGTSSSSVAAQESSSQSGDSHVKLSIKSFRVPELFIELPETATVGSLKRTVMEAVAAILGGGLDIGVLFQGKKVKDDTKTLLQTGICHNNKLDRLGFVLEPNHTNAPSLQMEDPPPFLVSCDEPQPQLQLPTRYPSTPPRDPETYVASLEPPLTDMANCFESDHDSVLTSTDMSTDKTTQDSEPMIAAPAKNVEAFAAVPLHRKSRQSDLVQRRIRRPFSVSEVEALVQAVEDLGTGRWRDVKLRAFDNAKHRTYVDLKDKWKTLVHTARISPQQRRGEPVPQELLDRVLSAHGYWSQQQAKQQVKQLTDTCLLLK